MADPSGWSGGDGTPPSGPPRSHLVLVAVLVLCAIALLGGTAALLLRKDSAPPPLAGPVTESPEAAPEPVRTPPPRQAASEGPTEPQPLRPGRRADLAALAREVAQVRRLPLRRRLEARVLGERALADKVSSLAFEELDPAETAADERLLVALRLAPPGIDLADALEGLYRAQVLGLYVPEERTLYVRSRGAGSPAQEMTAAHEIVHALQDQSFDLVELQERFEERSDAQLAVLSLIEGDATLTQQLWAQEHLSADELQRAAGELAGAGGLNEVPAYLRESLIFPYAKGGLFVADLFRNGGFAAVDEAFENLPTSSEQIMHPDRYREGDDPDEVRVRVRPGAGWDADATYELGAFDLDQMLRPLGSERAADAAEGWGGGTVRSWTDGDGTAVAARLTFDTEQDAAEVCEALPQWYATVADGTSTGSGTFAGDRDHFAFRCTADAVAFSVAPSPETARRLAGPP